MGSHNLKVMQLIIQYFLKFEKNIYSMTVVYALVYLYSILDKIDSACKEHEKYAKNSKSVSH